MMSKQIPKDVLDGLSMINGSLYFYDRKINGTDTGRGYKQVKILRSRYLVHRLIFACFYGFQPENVDHIDGNTLNNDPANLRAASKSENMTNRALQSNCKSGFTGVDFMVKSSTYRAQIHKDGKKIYLGTFKSIKDAIMAREKAEEELHADWSRKNRADKLLLAELERTK